MNYFISVCLLFSPICSYCQYLTKNYDYLSVSSGLPTNEINQITQDATGFIWMATNAGLVKYDGYEFEIFSHEPDNDNSLMSNSLTTVFVSSDQKIWIGYENAPGISYFDPVKKEIKHLKINSSLRNKTVTSFFEEDSTHLWISFRPQLANDPSKGNDYVLSMLNIKSEKFEFYGPLPLAEFTTEQLKDQALMNRYNAISLISEYMEGDSLMLATPLGLGIFDRGTKEFNYCIKNELDKTTQANFGIRQILKGEGTNLWLGTWAHGLVNYNSKEKKWSNLMFYPEYNAIRNVIHSFCSLNKNELLIGYDEELLSYNISENSFKVLPSVAPKISQENKVIIHQIFIDRQKNIWYVHNRGITLSRSNSEAYSFKQLPVINPTNGVYSGEVVTILKNPKYNETYYGLNFCNSFCVENTKENFFQTFPIPLTKDDMKGQVVNSIVMDYDNSPVIIARDYIIKYDRNKRTLKEWEILKKKAGSIRYKHAAVDKDGFLWITSSLSGIFQVRPEKGFFKNYKMSNTSGALISDSFLQCIVDDEGNLYFNGIHYLAFYHAKEKRFKNIKIKFGNSPHSLPIIINDIIKCGHDIFIGTQTGLLKLVNNKEAVFFEKTEITSDVLKLSSPNDSTIFVLGNGVFEYKVITKKIKKFSYRQGVPPYTNTLADRKGSDLGYLGGYYKLIDTSRNPISTNIAISSFNAFGKTVFNGNKITLDLEDNFFSIKFSAPNFTNPEEIAYSYKLEGFNNLWYPLSSKRTADFTNVPGGNYLFRVRSFNIYDKKNILASLDLPVFIRTPFYKTQLFIAFTILLLLAIVIYSIHYFISNLRKRHVIETEHSQKIFDLQASALRSQINPHFLFNALNSVNNFLLNENTLKANSYLTKLAKLIRRTLENSSSRTILLSEELDVLRMYIEIEQGRLDFSFDFSIFINSSVDPTTVRIYPMILQPYIENAIWHGLSSLKRKGELTISVEKKNDYIIIIIRDNGVGRSNKKERSDKASLGHKITTERIDTLNALYKQENKIHIVDLIDFDKSSLGTEVIITLNNIKSL
jgi:ligand-binding sensor domain-containing protein